MSDLKTEYSQRFPLLEELARSLESHIRSCLVDCERIAQVSARAKDIDGFLRKSAIATDGQTKYSHPLSQIQDQVGARIVTYFLSDVPVIGDTVRKYFHPIEDKLHVPDDDNEFGYIGQHFILLVPTDLFSEVDASMIPPFFELQIQTLFQHAWAEAEHDLGYKPSVTLSSLQKRKVAFTAAQAWGADLIFDELHRVVSGAG